MARLDRWISQLIIRTFAPLKRLIPIFLLSLYLISLTELNQLAKLPILIEHFKEHKSKNTELSLLQFLDMHYASSDVHDADYDQDMKLPFKSHDGCLGTNSIIFITNNFSCEVAKPLPVMGNMDYLTYNENLLPSAYLSFIWQPPKSC